jgi:hypothetical protein
VTSASSKAALGLAHLLTRRGVPVTGLTSARHLPFVAGLKANDQVLGYDQIAALPAEPAILVDTPATLPCATRSTSTSVGPPRRSSRAAPTVRLRPWPPEPSSSRNTSGTAPASGAGR